MYRTLRPFIFTLCPETAHRAAIKALRAGMLPKQQVKASAMLAQELFGCHFPHPVGLAAGFDKNAEAIDGVANQGMAFVECGTVTPKAQAGNPKPRIFRLTEQEAVINRLGFNNEGLECYVANIKQRKSPVIVGGNIGKNKDSEDAVADYVTCLDAVYAHVDYITVNISSPNTPGLRDLQAHESLTVLVRAMQEIRAQKLAGGEKYKSILVKIAPDLSEESAAMIAETALALSFDGLIVSNTTITRPDVAHVKPEWQTGGLSGKPLMKLATQTLANIARLTKGQVPLIGVGGIASAEDAYQKILHGASLVQVYTALIYQGFSMVPEVVVGIESRLKRDGFSHVKDAVGKAL